MFGNVELSSGKWYVADITQIFVKKFLVICIYIRCVDDVKFQLANDGLCEQLFKLVETYKTLADTIDARALMKLACDLIVLVLTGGKQLLSFYF